MNFDWQQNGSTFIAKITTGLVEIQEHRLGGYGVPIGREWHYLASIKDEQGSVIETMTLHDFEEAEMWLQARLPYYLESLPKPQRITARDVVHLCQTLIPDNYHPVYRDRLDHILTWMHDHVGFGKSIIFPQFELDWTETPTGFMSQTDFGQAIITYIPAQRHPFIINSSEHWDVKIVHPSGVEWVSHGLCSDVQSAQDWVHDIVRESYSPIIDERLQEGITFAFRVYQQILIANHQIEAAALLDDLESELINAII